MPRQATLAGFLHNHEGKLPTIGEAFEHADSEWRLLLATEKHVSLYGVDGVRVVEIIAEANCANTAGLHYHFGGVGGAIREIFLVRQRAAQAACRVGLDVINERAAKGDEISLQHYLILKALLWGCVTISTQPLCYYAGFFDSYRRWGKEWIEVAAKEFSEPPALGLERRLVALIQSELHLQADEQERRYFFTVGLIGRAIKKIEQDQRLLYARNRAYYYTTPFWDANVLIEVVESVTASLTLKAYRKSACDLGFFLKEVIRRIDRADWPRPQLQVTSKKVGQEKRTSDSA